MKRSRIEADFLLLAFNHQEDILFERRILGFRNPSSITLVCGTQTLKKIAAINVEHFKRKFKVKRQNLKEALPFLVLSRNVSSIYDTWRCPVIACSAKMSNFHVLELSGSFLTNIPGLWFQILATLECDGWSFL